MIIIKEIDNSKRKKFVGKTTVQKDDPCYNRKDITVLSSAFSRRDTRREVHEGKPCTVGPLRLVYGSDGRGSVHPYHGTPGNLAGDHFPADFCGRAGRSFPGPPAGVPQRPGLSGPGAGRAAGLCPWRGTGVSDEAHFWLSAGVSLCGLDDRSAGGQSVPVRAETAAGGSLWRRNGLLCLRAGLL